MRRVRIGRGDPKRRRHEGTRPDLANQPDGRERNEEATQMRHQEDVIPSVEKVSNGPGIGFRRACR